MEQLKNFLVRTASVKTAFLLSGSPEAEGLAQWMLETGKVKRICRSLSEMEAEALQPEALLFGPGQEEQAIKLADHMTLRLRYVAGWAGEGENWFQVWERYRNFSDTVYISLEGKKGKEVLEWEKEDTDIELSVIVPVYGTAEYLPRCLDSLLSWKAPYVEYLLVNDESPDNAGDMIREYAERDSRIRLIDRKNGGCAAARNSGLKEARGRYVGFVDSDDFIDSGMFYKLLKRALMGNFDLAYCGYREYREPGNSVRVTNDCLGEPFLSGTYRLDKIPLLAVKTRVAIWRCIYKRKLLTQNGIRFHEDLKRFDDLPFRVEAVFAARSAVCVPEYLYYYRTGRQGQDTGCHDAGLFVHFAIFEHLDRYTERFKDSRLKDLLQVIKLQTHGWGLSMIEAPYRREYRKKAVKQLDEGMGYFRTALLLLLYTGKKNLIWYTKGKLRNAFFP